MKIELGLPTMVAGISWLAYLMTVTPSMFLQLFFGFMIAALVAVMMVR